MAMGISSACTELDRRGHPLQVNNKWDPMGISNIIYLETESGRNKWHSPLWQVCIGNTPRYKTLKIHIVHHCLTRVIVTADHLRSRANDLSIKPMQGRSSAHKANEKPASFTITTACIAQVPLDLYNSSQVEK